ncbi:flagellar biosynthetic protein FliR [Rhodopila sp.]|uniref:flagellar biosynthetic protein FliR n=1 Tax=Rhodopila sp. TaxID=2480087 RepID=UPI003D09B988
MNPTVGELLASAPAFALILARVGATMTLMPGLGESSAPAVVRIGIALCITILLVPILQPIMPPVPSAGLMMALMVAGEVVTGLWFGWLTRVIALALPIGIQFVAYLLGLSSVLQPDPDLGAQSTALAKLFNLAAPVMILGSGLYTLPLRALVGLFQLIPPGHMLPAGDSLQVAVQAIGTTFNLALRVASPFVLAAIVWHVAMGQIARVMTRVQIYFVALPGQILGGLLLLATIGGAMIVAWRQGVETYLGALPGAG